MATENSDCFFPDGNIYYDDRPCFLGKEASPCCGSDWTCLTNGLCYNPETTELARGTCTDHAWGSSLCPQFCTKNEYDGETAKNFVTGSATTWGCSGKWPGEGGLMCCEISAGFYPENNGSCCSGFNAVNLFSIGSELGTAKSITLSPSSSAETLSSSSLEISSSSPPEPSSSSSSEVSSSSPPKISSSSPSRETSSSSPSRETSSSSPSRETSSSSPSRETSSSTQPETSSSTEPETSSSPLPRLSLSNGIIYVDGSPFSALFLTTARSTTEVKSTSLSRSLSPTINSNFGSKSNSAITAASGRSEINDSIIAIAVSTSIGVVVLIIASIVLYRRFGRKGKEAPRNQVEETSNQIVEISESEEMDYPQEMSGYQNHELPASLRYLTQELPQPAN